MELTNILLTLMLLLVCFIIQKTTSSSQKKGSFFEKEHNLNKREVKKILSSKGKNTNCECGIRKPSYGIINGRRTRLGEYPWQTALQTADGDHICGGVLISEQWVLTANHCPMEPGHVVIAGSSNLKRRHQRHQQVRTIERVIGHLDDLSYLEHDIKVLKVDSSFDFNDYVHPVCLPFNLEDETFAGETVEASGFGRFLRRSHISSPLLYKLYQTVLSNEECRNRKEEDIEEGHICAHGENVSGMCHGDSGGPLTYEVEPNHFAVVGLVSFGQWQCYNATVYTRVTSYLDWIIENTGIQDFCKPF